MFVGGVTLAALVVLWVVWPRPQPAPARVVAITGALLCAVVIAGPPAPSGMSLVIMDVGQGDGILVRDGPHAVLVDAAPDAGSLRKALGASRVRSLDAVVITHLHEDHYGGIGALEDGVRVGRIAVARGAKADLPEEMARMRAPVTELTPATTLRCGQVTLRCLATAGRGRPRTQRGERRSARRGAGVLGAADGDAENDVLEPLAASGRLGDIDVLKVGHHGSRDALGAGLLDMCARSWRSSAWGQTTAMIIRRIRRSACSKSEVSVWYERTSPATSS